MITSPGGLVDNTVSTAKLQDGAVTYPKAGTGTLRLLATTTLTGAATSASFTGLSLDGKTYLITANFIRNGGAESIIYMYFNNDTNNANYKTIRLYGTGAAAGSTNMAYPLTCYFNTPSGTAISYHVNKESGQTPHAIGNTGVGDVSTAFDAFHITWTGTANITRIDFTADAANGLGIGTRISIYAVD